jgi:hypothetical protein
MMFYTSIAAHNAGLREASVMMTTLFQALRLKRLLKRNEALHSDPFPRWREEIQISKSL